MNISNIEDDRIIDGSSSADSICNSGNGVSIYAYSGDDTIYNQYSDDAYIEAGKGNDSIENYNTSNVTIYAGEGNDSIYNHVANNVTINAGAGADTIYNTCDNVSIDGGAGKDSIYSYFSSEGTTYGGAGNDTIQVYNYDGGEDFIDGGADADYISVGGYYTSYDYYNTINGGAGNDTIYNSTNVSTLNGGDGNDSLYSGGNSISASGGAGDDLISLGSDNEENTISGGAGNDTIILQNQNHLVQYASGDGNDIIEGFNRSDTLHITSGSITKAGYSGDDAIIYVGNNYIIFKDAAERSLNLQIGNGAAFSTVLSSEIDFSGGGEDTGSGGEDDEENYIINSTASTLLSGTAGADNITNSGKNVTILGNAGNDFIFNTGANVLINGGAGNDTINNKGKNATIIGGAGNDIISLSSAATGTLIKYSSGEGKDTIIGFDSNDSLEVSGGSYTTAKSGNDILVTFDSGSLLIKNTSKISVIGGSSGGGDDEESELPDGWKYANTAKTSITATLASADDLDLTEDYGAGVIKVDGSKTTGGVVITGNDKNNSIKGGKGADLISGGYGNDTVSLGAGNDTYIYTSGNDLIQDFAAGDVIQIDIGNIEISGVSTVGSNVLIETSEGNLIIKNGASKEISLVDGDGAEIDLGGEEEITLPDGWKFGTSSKTNTNAEIITATLKTAENIDLTENYGEGVVSINAATITAGVEIIANDNDNSIKGSKGADIISGGYGDDTVSLGGGDDIYIYSGGNDVIQDYVAGHDSIQIEIDDIENISVETVGSDVIYTTSEGTLKVAKGKGKDIVLMDENGDQIIFDAVKIPAGWQLDSAKNLLKATVASADNEIDLTEAYGDGVTKVDAMKITGGVVIIGNDEDNSLKGGKGADEISGGSGNDTVSLGGGADVYIYSGGDDVIQDYVAGTDSIQINTGDIEVENVSTVGNDIIYETSAGNLKVVKGKGKEITLMDENGAEIVIGGVEYPDGWKFDSAKSLLQATISSAVDEIDLSESYGAGVEKVDGSKITSGVVIYGNDDNISMKGSKSADTISGGTGNDTVSLGGGADVYIYNGGDDYIHDYANVDSIQIDTDEITINGISTVSTNKIIETSEGNITLKSGKTKTLNLIDSNGEEIAVSGRVAENVWFLEDDNNFVASDIDSIVEEKFAVTEIQSSKVEELSQPVLTFAEEK